MSKTQEKHMKTAYFHAFGNRAIMENKNRWQGGALDVHKAVDPGTAQRPAGGG